MRSMSWDEISARITGGEDFVHLSEDPWGSPYQLHIDGEDVCVSSNGPDGERWTDDDVRAE